MRFIFLLLVCGSVIGDAQLIGSSSTHYMFSYHGEPLFCPRELGTVDMVTCLDGSLKYVVCRIIPPELGHIDCGHITDPLPDEREAGL